MSSFDISLFTSVLLSGDVAVDLVIFDDRIYAVFIYIQVNRMYNDDIYIISNATMSYIFMGQKRNDDHLTCKRAKE